jgi:DNA polymerase (family 10)
MAMTNHQIADLFEEMADLSDLLGGDKFRAIALQKIARVLRELPDDLCNDPAVCLESLQKLEGIGKSSAQRILECLQTGRIAEHQQMLAQVPPGLLTLLNVPGVGAKTVALLWKEGQVQSCEDFKTRLAAGGLKGIKGLGDKKLANILANLELAQTANVRVNIGRALPAASWFVGQLRQIKGVKQAAYAGSLRRGRETVGDLDLLAAVEPADAPAVSDAFTRLPAVKEVIGQGPTKTSIRTSDGVQVDLRIVDPSSFGAALLYFTGSKDHNVLLRQRAIDQGMKLNEYSLSRDGVSVASASEQDVYAALGLDWIPPELREAREEISQAQNKQLPTLVRLDDILAELHTHTKASDGKWSVEELVSFAADRGFHTLAITDHSKSQVQAHGLTVERLVEHVSHVREVAARVKGKITVLAGAEVDILTDGELDYPNSVLRELDVVVASPHASLTQDSAKATKRLLRAIENPCVTILGHPTGRLVQRREGLSPDMKSLYKAASQRGIALEINANSHRLDLRDIHARGALEHGCKLAINTDAHGPADFDQLVYGLLTARRAGATAKDVVNCLDSKSLRAWIKSTRR